MKTTRSDPFEHAVVARRDREGAAFVTADIAACEPSSRHGRTSSRTPSRAAPDALPRASTIVRGAADSAGVVHLFASTRAPSAISRSPSTIPIVTLPPGGSSSSGSSFPLQPARNDHEGEETRRGRTRASLRITLPCDSRTGVAWEDRGPSKLVLLQLSDPAATERLAAFLRSLGQTATVVDDGRVELDVPDDEAARAEVEIYLRVWRVLNPADEVTPAE